MSFYDNPENVDKYIGMCSEYDGAPLYQFLAQYLSKGCSLLELGSGAGTDIEFLKNQYQVVGSDLSSEFLRRCKVWFPDLPFIKLDAKTLEVEQSFDCIYSNKVLHHLSEKDLRISFKRQSELLNSNGLVAHSFWLGEGSDKMYSLLFKYYSEDELVGIISDYFDVKGILAYQEFEAGDSLFIIAAKA